MKIKARKTRVVETKKKMKREKVEENKEKTKIKKYDGSKESGREMRNLKWWEEDSKVWKRD